MVAVVDIYRSCIDVLLPDSIWRRSMVWARIADRWALFVLRDRHAICHPDDVGHHSALVQKACKLTLQLEVNEP